MQPDQPYAVLGLHGPDVPTVTGNVARVRMFVNGQMIDEDFSLPKLITVEEQIDTAVTARIAEIEANGPDPAKSDVIPEQTEQIIADIPVGEGGLHV